MISIVIPNFNSAALLAKNLPRLFGLLKKTRLDYEIVVSDDASTDGSLSYLRSLRNLGNLNLRVLVSRQNTGFAGNVDRGIRAARGEVVFVLKTDVLPKGPDYFQLVLNHFQSNLTNKSNLTNFPVFAVSAGLQTIENGKKEIRGCGEIYFEKGFLLHRRSQPNLSNRSNKSNSLFSAWADGGACAIRRNLYLKLGGFDPLYNPFYWEDVDLGYRAWEAGYKIVFEPRAVLRHAHESGAIRRHYSSAQIKTISLRNQFIFTWKNADIKHLFLYCLWEPYHTFIALKNRDILWFWAYWQAVSKLPEIFKRRILRKRAVRVCGYDAGIR